jgi:hypothetical protein
VNTLPSAVEFGTVRTPTTFDFGKLADDAPIAAIEIIGFGQYPGKGKVAASSPAPAPSYR